MKKLYTLLVASFMAATAGFGQNVTLVKDINPGTGNSSPANLFIDGSYIYFAADDAGATIDHGKELWRTNGTTTELVKDVRSGSSNSTPGNFFNLNNTLYFTAHNGTTSVVHSTDGTDAGTVDLYLYTGAFFPQEYNGTIYFVNTTDGNSLYTFDGTNMQKVNNSTTFSDNIPGGIFTFFNGKILLYMKNALEDASNIQGTEVGTELYEYDFSTGQYNLIKNIAEDVLSPAESVDINSSSISNMTVIGSKVYFEALNTLWETDGTTDGTIEVSVASGISGVANFYAWNNKLYFEGDNGTDGDQLYVYDPSGSSVTNLSNISGTNSDHNPSDYCVYNGYLYYAGCDNNDTKKHLFRTDGSSVEQLDATIIDVDEIVELNGILYFEAEDATGTETTGNELFSFDPSTYIPNSIDKTYLNALSLYPNPTKGTINISGLETSDVAYTVYDISGRTIQSGITNTQISLNCAPGIYIIELKDGNKITTHKVQVK